MIHLDITAIKTVLWATYHIYQVSLTFRFLSVEVAISAHSLVQLCDFRLYPWVAACWL